MATVEQYETRTGATRYRVRYRVDKCQTSRRGFRTKKEAQQFAATVETSMMRGEYVSPSLGRTSIGALGPGWLERQRGHIKPASHAAFDSAWRVNVAPHWGSVRIADIRRSHVQAWIADLSAQRGAETVRAAHRVLARILDDAVADHMLSSNPARGVKLPKGQPRHNTYLTAHQLDRLAQEAGEYRSMVLLLGVGGLRWGEAAALTVADIDFLRRRLQLHRNAVLVRGQMVVGSLKSNKTRSVSLSAFVIEALAATAQGKGRDELLWSTPSGGYLRPPHKPSWLSRAVARCQQADPDFPDLTAHDLRHTAACLAISAGANPKVVQRMLGHASAAMTLDTYADLFDSDADQVAVTVSKIWPRASSAAT